MTTKRNRRARMLGLCALAVTLAGAGAADRASAAAPAVSDWTAVSANTAGGALAGASVSLSGTHVWNTPTSVLDGSWPYFAGPAFSPALAKSDAIQISGAPGASYTLRFGAPVVDPTLELGSLGSRIDFPAGTPVARLSGEAGFTVSGSSVSGTPSNTIGSSGNSDASGTIRLTGSYSTITFKATPNYTGPEDGIIVQLVTQAVPAPPPPPSCANTDMTITAANLTAAEDAIVCLTNQERSKAGLLPLAVNPTLRGVARAHSRDMVQRRFFSHTNPEGKEPCDRILAAGYPTRCIFDAGQRKIVCWTGRCGENIAWAYPVTPNRVMYDPQFGWMTHPGSDGTVATNLHRKAILTPQFKDVGVGVAAGNPQGGTQGATVTEDFGSPS